MNLRDAPPAAVAEERPIPALTTAERTALCAIVEGGQPPGWKYGVAIARLLELGLIQSQRFYTPTPNGVDRYRRIAE